MDIIISDFDDTLFKRNYGLIEEVVEYLEEKELPVYIVTYRGHDQLEFIAGELATTKLEIVGYAFAGSRKKDPFTKLNLIDQIRSKYNVVEALDDDSRVVLALRGEGINAHQALNGV